MTILREKIFFVDDGIDAGIDVSWTLFDGFKTVANYDRLRELHLLSSTQTRLAVEDYVAELTAEKSETHIYHRVYIISE